MNFTRAADDLGLTQSGISRQIRNLEDFLGTTLFHRSGPRLVLTEVGANYYRDLAFTLDRLEEISIDAVRGRSVDSSLMVGTHPTFAARWLPQRLSTFISAFPDIPLEFTLATPATDFETTRLDITVLRGLARGFMPARLNFSLKNLLSLQHPASFHWARNSIHSILRISL